MIIEANTIAGLGLLAVDLDLAGLDRFLDERTAVVGEHRRQIGVQTDAFDLVPGSQLDDVVGHDKTSPMRTPARRASEGVAQTLSRASGWCARRAAMAIT